MLELAANFEGGELVRIRAIAGNHGIPSRFLVQILLQLKNAGLVASTRGAAGGYKLLKAPESVTLGEVISAIEGPLGRDQTSMTADSAAAQALLDVCNEIADKQREMLDSVTIADLQERVRRAPSDMYYI